MFPIVTPTPHLKDVFQWSVPYVGQVSRQQPPFPLYRVLFLLLAHILFLLAVSAAQVEEHRLVLVLVASLLSQGTGLRLGLVVQKKVRCVVAPAVGHHYSADGAGVDVLDLEEALDHIHIL